MPNLILLTSLGTLWLRYLFRLYHNVVDKLRNWVSPKTSTEKKSFWREKKLVAPKKVSGPFVAFQGLFRVSGELRPFLWSSKRWLSQLSGGEGSWDGVHIPVSRHFRKLSKAA